MDFQGLKVEVLRQDPKLLRFHKILLIGLTVGIFEKKIWFTGLCMLCIQNANKCWITFWRFFCHFDAYFEGLQNPITICGGMIRWVSYFAKG